MKIQVKSLSISHLPSFISGFNAFSNNARKGDTAKRLADFIQLPFKLKRRWTGKASLTNKKRYADQIGNLVHSGGNSQESAEMLVDTSMVNVINIILSKEKESGLYKFFQTNNPGLSAEKDVPLAWYFMDEMEKRLWHSLYECPLESADSEDENNEKRIKRKRADETASPKAIQPNTSQLLETNIPIKPNTSQSIPTKTSIKTMASVSIPDALYESQTLLQELINAFVSIEITEDITLVKYLIGSCKTWSKWLDWYTVLCSKNFASLAELQTTIIDKLKEMRQNLQELNLTRSSWFNIVKLFIKARDEICTNRLQTKLCALEMEKDSQKFIYKSFQRTLTFTVNSTKYGHPDFLYVKNVVGELKIAKVHKLNEKTKTFTGYLFTLENPAQFPEYRTTTITNSVTYLEKNCKSELYEFHMHDVVGKCLVLNGEDYFLGRPTDIKEKDIFCCTLVWKLAEDVLIENFTLPVLNDGLKKYWGEVYYFKLDGTEKLLDDKKQEEIQKDENIKVDESIISSDNKNDENPSPTIAIQNLRELEPSKLQTKDDPFKLYDSRDSNNLVVKDEEDVIIID